MRMLLCLFLLSGCALRGPDHLTLETGFGGDLFLADVIRPDENPRSMHHVEATVGWEVCNSDKVAFDVGVGGNVFTPLDNEPGSAGVGFTLLLRPRVRITDDTWLIFPMSGGYDYFHDKWDPQSTNDGFVLSLGPGIKWDLDDYWSLLASYRFVHESNGNDIFDRDERNPGFNGDFFYFGVEVKLGDGK